MTCSANHFSGVERGFKGFPGPITVDGTKIQFSLPEAF